MNYVYTSNTSYKASVHWRAIIFVLFQALFLVSVRVQATTPTQYAEMATALATIPFDIAAHHVACTNKDAQTATKLHIAAQTITILNKVLFLYNNISGQKELYGGKWTIKSRDFLVNSAFLVRNVIRLDQHLRDLMSISGIQDDVALSLNDLAPEISLNQNLNSDVLDPEQAGKIAEISKLAYAWEVLMLPVFKGLTAFVLACTQEEATSSERYSNIQARRLATATHSLVNLAEEYTMLKPDSDNKKFLAALLFVNTVWLIYEAQKYIRELPAAYVPMRKVRGDCTICLGENKELNELHCGHMYCQDCLAGQINVQFTDKRATLDQTQCLNPDCRVHMSRGAMAEILDKHKDKDRILTVYDEIIRDRKKKKVLDDEAKAAIMRLGAKPCPQCKVPIQKNMGCDHMTCRCGHQFWWSCLGTYPNCNTPNCRFHARGGGPMPFVFRF